MTGRTLDAYKQVPKRLWQHLGEQLGIDPPDLGTLRVLYDDRTDTLADHQKLAYETLGFQPMAEHLRRYVVRWLKERLSGRQDRSTALLDLKQWLYEYRVLIVHDRALRQLMMIALERTKAQIRARVEHPFHVVTSRTCFVIAQGALQGAAQEHGATVQSVRFGESGDRAKPAAVDSWDKSVMRVRNARNKAHLRVNASLNCLKH